MGQYGTDCIQGGDSTITIVAGSNVVTATGSEFVGRVEIGNMLKITGEEDGLNYTISEVTDDTHLKLSAPHATGVTDADYVIVSDFTPIFNLPLMNAGDGAAAECFTRAMGIIDAQMAKAAAPGGILWKNTLIISAAGGHFTTITAALNSISDASPTNRYLILVMPGVYVEQVTMKAYVSITGLTPCDKNSAATEIRYNLTSDPNPETTGTIIAEASVAGDFIANVRISNYSAGITAHPAITAYLGATVLSLYNVHLNNSESGNGRDVVLGNGIFNFHNVYISAGYDMISSWGGIYKFFDCTFDHTFASAGPRNPLWLSTSAAGGSLGCDFELHRCRFINSIILAVDAATATQNGHSVKLFDCIFESAMTTLTASGSNKAGIAYTIQGSGYFPTMLNITGGNDTLALVNRPDFIDWTSTDQNLSTSGTVASGLLSGKVQTSEIVSGGDAAVQFMNQAGNGYIAVEMGDLQAENVSAYTMVTGKIKNTAGVAIRNDGDSADAPLSASTGTFSGAVSSAGSTVTGKKIVNATLNAATGDETAMELNYTANKATSGDDNGLKIVQTDTASPGASYLIRGFTGATQKFFITNLGWTSFIGDDHSIEFNYGSNQDAYIRPGKDAGKVVMDYGTVEITSKLKIPTATPANAGAEGTVGQICWDSSFIYICTAANTWKRVAISTW